MPFDPEGLLQDGVTIDTLQERECRLPGQLAFEYSDLQYVIVDSIKDAMNVGLEIGAKDIPPENVIPMEVYRTIGNAWREG